MRKRKAGVRNGTLRRFAAGHPQPEANEPPGTEAAVRRAVFRLSTGYTVSVKKHYKVAREKIDRESGEKLKHEEVVERVDEVYVPPSVSAGIFWLKHFAPRETLAGEEPRLLRAASALLDEVETRARERKGDDEC